MRLVTANATVMGRRNDHRRTLREARRDSLLDDAQWKMEDMEMNHECNFYPVTLLYEGVDNHEVIVYACICGKTMKKSAVKA